MSSGLTTVSIAQGWPGDRPGGLNRYAADLHEGLVARGVDDRLVVFGPAVDSGRAVHPTVREEASFVRRVSAMTAQSRAVGEDADVVASHSALYGSAPRTLTALRRKPWVAHFHGPWGAEASAQGSRGLGPVVKHAVERQHLRSSAAVITASQAFADLALQVHGLPAHKVHPIHPGVDLVRFSPVSEDSRGDLRARLGVDRESFLVVTARRLVARMGLEVLLRAWPQMPGGRLAVLGGGPLLPDLTQQSQGLDGVSCLGRVSESDLVAWYRAADLVVIPSVQLEGFGLVVLEALACGTPVLASAVGGLSEVLPQLGDDLLVPPGDALALRRAIEAAAQGECPSRADNRRLAERYSLDRFAADVSEVYAQSAAL